MELAKYLNSGETDSSSQLTGHGDYLKGDHIRKRTEGDRHTALGRQGQEERKKKAKQIIHEIQLCMLLT